MQLGGAFVDYYETLQISPNADQETVQRVYRMLAQRYHPDNSATGDAEMFRQVTEAYETLGDLERRGGYDAYHRDARRLTWKIFDQTTASQGVEAERRKRQGILSLLYRKRMMQPDNPGMMLKDFEDLLGVPREHLEFSLWYLKEGQYLQRFDNGRHTITLKGVELAESAEIQVAPHQMLPSAARVA